MKVDFKHSTNSRKMKSATENWQQAEAEKRTGCQPARQLVQLCVCVPDSSIYNYFRPNL